MDAQKINVQNSTAWYFDVTAKRAAALELRGSLRVTKLRRGDNMLCSAGALPGARNSLDPFCSLFIAYIHIKWFPSFVFFFFFCSSPS